MLPLQRFARQSASAGTADVNWITQHLRTQMPTNRFTSVCSSELGDIERSVGEQCAFVELRRHRYCQCQWFLGIPIRTARTAMITNTALVDAGRQIAAWFDRTVRDNDQADADVQYIQSIASPETQLAVPATQRENQYATFEYQYVQRFEHRLDTSGRIFRVLRQPSRKTAAVDSLPLGKPIRLRWLA